MNRKINQWEDEKNPEIGPNTKEKLVFRKAGISNWGKNVFFNK